MTIDDLIEKVSEEDKRILAGIWQNCLELNATKIIGRIIRNQFGRSTVERSVRNLCPIFLNHINSSSKTHDYYEMTTEGIYLLEGENGPNFKLLILALTHYKETFKRTPDFMKIISGNLKTELKIDNEQVQLIGAMLHLNNTKLIGGSSTGVNTPEWEAGVMDDVEILAETERPLLYLKMQWNENINKLFHQKRITNRLQGNNSPKNKTQKTGTFGKWRVLKQLNVGGQGFIYSVKNVQDKDGAEYVLKRLKNPKRIDRFKSELKAMTVLEHPNIVKVIDSDLDAKKPYIVMDKIDGLPLDPNNYKSKNLEDSLDLFQKICNAVAHAHYNDVLHRDIKPENIVVRNNDDLPVIIDFGLCLFLDDEQRFTGTDEAPGSRRYSAPEIEKGGRQDYKKSADVYSLGKILFQMITGKLVYREEVSEFENPEHDEIRHILDPIFSKTIVQDEKARFQDAVILSDNIRKAKKILKMGGQPIGINSKKECIYCRNGEYKIMADSLNKYDRFQTDEFNKILNGQFGINPQNEPAKWILMVCDNCSNIQWFRPDLIQGGMQWTNGAMD